MMTSSSRRRFFFLTFNKRRLQARQRRGTKEKIAHESQEKLSREKGTEIFLSADDERQ